MSTPQPTPQDVALDDAILKIEEALTLCDQFGFSFPAIDLASAIAKLRDLQADF